MYLEIFGYTVPYLSDRGSLFPSVGKPLYVRARSPSQNLTCPQNLDPPDVRRHGEINAPEPQQIQLCLGVSSKMSSKSVPQDRQTLAKIGKNRNPKHTLKIRNAILWP